MKLYEFDAIGTHWWLEMLSDQEFTDELIAALHRTADLFDQRYSRFRDDSLVSELARTGRLSNPPEELLRMLDFCKEVYEVTDGAFDIAVGATLHRLGYGERAHGRALPKDIWSDIVYTKHEVTIPRGLMLDLGGCGKGWLINLFVDVLRQVGIDEFIVNGGGDIYCQSDTPIEFALEDPYDPTKRIGQTQITHGALAASNTIKRAWLDGDEHKHHIIDPERDDSSDTGIVASYVRADSALIADTMATIMILRPETQEALSERYNLQVILVKEKAP